MPLVSLAHAADQICAPAAEHAALPAAYAAFAVHNGDFVRAVIRAAEEVPVPVALSVNMQALAALGVTHFAAVCIGEAERASVPVAVHLNHADSVDVVRQALDAGFTSVMFDGSSVPVDDNSEAVSTIVSLARTCGASVEGEVRMPPSERAGGQGTMPAYGSIARSAGCDPAEIYLSDERIRRFAQETGIDFLAVSVGDAHGMAPVNDGIRYGLDVGALTRVSNIVRSVVAESADSAGVDAKRIASSGSDEANTAHAATASGEGDLPRINRAGCRLALHKASALTDEELRLAVRLGVCRVNVNNALKRAWCCAYSAQDAAGGSDTGDTFSIQTVNAVIGRAVAAMEKEAVRIMRTLRP